MQGLTVNGDEEMAPFQILEQMCNTLRNNGLRTTVNR